MSAPKKSIIYIGGFELPDKNAAAQRVITNGKIFESLDYEVFYLGIDRDINFDGIQSIKNFNMWSVKYPHNLLEWVQYLSDIKYIQIFIERHLSSLPSIVVAYNFPAIALANLKKYCKKNEIALISDCTEWYEASGNLVFRIIKSCDTFLRMRYLHLKLDGIIVISRYLYVYYRKKKNVLLLPPLVDVSDQKWDGIDEEFCMSNDSCHLLYAGSPGMGGKDRLDKVIKALSILKNNYNKKFELIVIGITKDQYLKAFGSDVALDDLENGLHFLGRLPHGKVIKLIKKADYFIFLRDHNRVTTAGFPTKFVEAITCGTPVLTNASSNIGDYLIEGVNGFLLDSSTEQTLVDSLSFAVTQTREVIDKMKQYCRNSKEFDYTKYIEKTDEFLSKIIDKRD